MHEQAILKHGKHSVEDLYAGSIAGEDRNGKKERYSGSNAAKKHQTSRIKRLVQDEVIASTDVGSGNCTNSQSDEAYSSKLLRQAREAEEKRAASLAHRFRSQEHFWTSMTNEALKELLKPLGLSRSGDKQALISRLAEERNTLLAWLPEALRCDARDRAAKAAGKKGAR